jgi:fucose permease
MIQRYLQEAADFTKTDAAKMIALYWGGAMIGRFYASFMLSNVEKARRTCMLFLFLSGLFGRLV